MESIGKSDKWLAVVNVYAASKKAGSLWNKAEAYLNAVRVDFDSRMTGKQGNASDIAARSCAEGYRKFIAVGGDGTVHDVLNGIARYVMACKAAGSEISLSDFTLAVIPVGSGNDWIKTAGVPRDMQRAVALISDGSVGRQDVARVEVLNMDGSSTGNDSDVSYMANVAGVGIDARVCERVNMKKVQGMRGKKLYVGALIHAIRNRVPAFAKVVCDGQEVFDGAYLSIAFGLGKYSGGGMRQTPEAVLDDGLLDMTLIPDLPLMRIAREVPRLFTGTFLKVRELAVACGKCIEVFPYNEDCRELVEVDGEVVGCAPVRIEIMPEQINIVQMPFMTYDGSTSMMICPS